MPYTQRGLMGGRERERGKKPRKPGLLLLLLGQTAVQPDSTVAIKRARLCTILCLHMQCAVLHAARHIIKTLQQRMDQTKSVATQNTRKLFCCCRCVCVWGPVGAEEGQWRPQISPVSGRRFPRVELSQTALLSFSFRGKSLLPACFCSRPQKICGSQH